LIQHVQPLLVKHRVDVYLSGGRLPRNCLIPSRSSSLIRPPGHVHAYERTCVLNGPGECALSTADGFVHIVAGAIYIENNWNLVLTSPTGMAGNDYQVSWANTK
jgi:hypothetical protein